MTSPDVRLWLKRLALIALGIFAVLVIWVIVAITRDRPVDYADIQEHFKYGSIGSEPVGSRANSGHLQVGPDRTRAGRFAAGSRRWRAPAVLGVQVAAVRLP